jgi:hypothetical protein
VVVAAGTLGCGGKHMSMLRSFVATAASLGFAALLAATPARAANETRIETKADDGGREGEAGLGVAAGLISLVYAPAKVLYAAGGGLVAGLAYVFSAGDQQIVDPILTPALRGDYVVTPAHLRGDRQLEFIGREPEDAAPRDKSGQAASHPGGDGLDAAPAVSGDATDPAEAASEPQ